MPKHKSINGTADNKNTLRVVSRNFNANETVTVNYDIMKESPYGGLEFLNDKDILPNRLCILRVSPTLNNTVILVNNPDHGAITCSDVSCKNISCSGSASVYNSDSDKYEKVLTESDYNKLMSEIKALKINSSMEQKTKKKL